MSIWEHGLAHRAIVRHDQLHAPAHLLAGSNPLFDFQRHCGAHRISRDPGDHRDGVFVAVYTIVGGIEAVVWTDVLQGIILLAGGLFSLVCLATDLPGRMGQIFEIGLAHDKFWMGPANFNLNERTIWTAIVLGVFTWIAYQTEQNLVQRYIAASSTREARKATLIYGVIALPT